MAAVVREGARKWSLVRDENWYRDYKVTYLVETSLTDGPYAALYAPGLPLPGSIWSLENDIDQWVWFRPNATVTQLRENKPNRFYEVELMASNRPPSRDSAQRQRCSDQQIDDPLLQPNKVTGGTNRGSKEYQHSYSSATYAQVIFKNSSHQQLEGPDVTFDSSTYFVRISQNVPALELPLLESMRDCVNDAPLWGFDARCVRLASWTWDQSFWGQCYRYFIRNLEFEVNEETFDREVYDRGTMVLNGEWSNGAWVLKNVPGGGAPDKNNPNHFIRLSDVKGNTLPFVFLDGNGKPVTRAEDAALIELKAYNEVNFSALNIPLTLG